MPQSKMRGLQGREAMRRIPPSYCRTLIGFPERLADAAVTIFQWTMEVMTVSDWSSTQSIAKS